MKTEDRLARILAVIAMLMALVNEVVSYRDHVNTEARLSALENPKPAERICTGADSEGNVISLPCSALENRK